MRKLAIVALCLITTTPALARSHHQRPIVVGNFAEGLGYGLNLAINDAYRGGSSQHLRTARHQRHYVRHHSVHLGSLVATINYKLARYVHPTGKCPGGREVLATYYWDGQRVASGGRFNPDGLTFAHRRMAFGTTVRFTNPHNGRSVTATCNDRGPFTNAEFDLSRGTARALGMNTSIYVCAGG